MKWTFYLELISFFQIVAIIMFNVAKSMLPKIAHFSQFYSIVLCTFHLSKEIMLALQEHRFWNLKI